MKTKILLLIVLGLGKLFVVAQAAPAPFDAEIKNNSLAITADERLAAVSYSDTPRVLIYDVTAGKVVHTLDQFVTPRNLLFSRDGKNLYATDSTLGEVIEFETKSFSVTRRFAIGAGAFGSALAPDGKTLYVNNEAANTVTEINLAQGGTAAVIKGFAEPRQGIKVAADGRLVFVTNFSSDQVIVFDSATRKIVQHIDGFHQLRAISLSKEGRTLFAANSKTNEIAVVELASGKVAKLIPVGRDPYGATLSADERQLLTASKQDGTLDVIDLGTGTRKSIPGFNEPRQALVYGRNGDTAYVLNKDLSIALVNLANAKIVRLLAPDN